MDAVMHGVIVDGWMDVVIFRFSLIAQWHQGLLTSPKRFRDNRSVVRVLDCT